MAFARRVNSEKTRGKFGAEKGMILASLERRINMVTEKLPPREAYSVRRLLIWVMMEEEGVEDGGGWDDDVGIEEEAGG